MPWDDDADAVSTASAIAVGELADPAVNPLGWSGVGGELSTGLRQALAKGRTAPVRSEAALAAEVLRAVAGSGDQLPDRLKRIHQRHPDVRLVVAGRVVEFRHQTIRRGGINRSSASHDRNEAIVILHMTAVDLARRRVAMDQRIEAHAWADEGAIEQIYRGVSPGTHRFWETPLGLASRDAVNQACARINAVAPHQAPPPIRIVKRLSERRVRLSSDASAHSSTGEVFDVCIYDSGGAKLKPVMDADTGRALQARIESLGSSPSAWLLGRPPANIAIEQAVLREAGSGAR